MIISKGGSQQQVGVCCWEGKALKVQCHTAGCGISAPFPPLRVSVPRHCFRGRMDATHRVRSASIRLRPQRRQPAGTDDGGPPSGGHRPSLWLQACPPTSCGHSPARGSVPSDLVPRPRMGGSGPRAWPMSLFLVPTDLKCPLRRTAIRYCLIKYVPHVCATLVWASYITMAVLYRPCERLHGSPSRTQ